MDLAQMTTAWAIYHMTHKTFVEAHKKEPVFPDDYNLIAILKSGHEENAWTATNHIENSWHKDGCNGNGIVMALFTDKVRSSMTGDVFMNMNDCTLHKVMGLGFQQISVKEVNSHAKD